VSDYDFPCEERTLRWDGILTDLVYNDGYFDPDLGDNAAYDATYGWYRGLPYQSSTALSNNPSVSCVIRA
jgi:hypothetical protein